MLQVVQKQKQVDFMLYTIVVDIEYKDQFRVARLCKLTRMVKIVS